MLRSIMEELDEKEEAEKVIGRKQKWIFSMF